MAWGIVSDDTDTAAWSDHLLVDQVVDYCVHGGENFGGDTLAMVRLLVFGFAVVLYYYAPVVFSFVFCAQRVKLFSFSFSLQTFFSQIDVCPDES